MKFDQPLKLGQLALLKISDLLVGKAAENEIHLAGAAVPAAKQQPLAAEDAVPLFARIKAFRAEGRDA